MANLGKAYEGVQVTKQGGVQSVPSSSIQYPDQNEVNKLLEQQVRFAEQAQLEKEKALREADVQNQLQLEAAELARVGRQRYQNTAEGLSVAENEVALAIEKERHFGTSISRVGNNIRARITHSNRKQRSKEQELTRRAFAKKRREPSFRLRMSCSRRRLRRPKSWKSCMRKTK